MNLAKYDEKKVFFSKGGVKSPIISGLVITFSVGGVWVYFWRYLSCLIVPAGIYIYIYIYIYVYIYIIYICINIYIYIMYYIYYIYYVLYIYIYIN